ncbi:MAG TPA: DUF1587 domain-containing protein, partial [Vicinamibacterales bacterium]|nr:DUF1587 domain-containing protein [Vicinamibacterales bacterium]
MPLAVSGAPAAMTFEQQTDAVKQFCVTCHNDMIQRGQLSLASFDASKVTENAAIAEKMIRKLRTGMMPPKEAAKQPDAATRLALVTSLETALDKAALTHPNPGRRPFQRLNRAEYGSAIKTIFGLDIDVATFLPSDTISASFDNIADVQMPSATVM